jgi:calcium-dependent protein kinase
MLCDEEVRFSAEKVLNHPWLTKLSPNIKHTISQSSIIDLKNYKNNNTFKRFILTCLANRLKEQEIKELKEIFMEMDTNKDGTLTPEELKTSLKKFMEEKEINQIFSEIDTNNSNQIEYTEFLSALIEKKEYLKEEKLLEIFKTLDKDGNGVISKDEIKKVLNGQDFEEKDLKQFITKFDLDGDGQIDYYEFVSNMNDLKIK